jgi:hypothetical protein
MDMHYIILQRREGETGNTCAPGPVYWDTLNFSVPTTTVKIVRKSFRYFQLANTC